MKNALLGIINATKEFTSLQELTAHRSLAALPFGGRYRLIDFMLSNMVHSKIQSVAIFTGHENRSLMDHVGSGKQWDLDRKRDGLFVFTPNAQCENEDFGSFHHFGKNKDYFLRSKQDYVVITAAHIVTAIDFQAVLQRHIETNADITEVRHNGRSLRTYILKKDLLVKLFEQYKDTDYYNMIDLVNDKKEKFRIHTYEHTGYTAVITSVESYYKHSFEMLEPNIWKQLFLKDRPIYTKVKDEPPTRYAKAAHVSHSMVANGSVIAGEVAHSILFRSVQIGRGSVVRNSIIMQKTIIGENCVLDGVILDKDVKIEDGTVLTKVTDQEPYIVGKGMIRGALMKS